MFKKSYVEKKRYCFLIDFKQTVKRQCIEAFGSDVIITAAPPERIR
jgi:hypothetical protein